MAKVREEYDDVQSEPVFNRLPGDLQIEFRRLIANGRKRTKGRAKVFKASTTKKADHQTIDAFELW